MNNSSHPSSVLKQKVTDIIRDSAAKAEKDGRFSKTQLNLIAEQQWFKMLAPSSMEGLQMALPAAVRLTEGISWADGSAGWAIAQCAVASWQTAFIDAEVAKGILGDAKVGITYGEGNGTAEKKGDDYVVSGKWNYATGTNDATAFIGNCIETVNGEAVKNESGNANILSFIFMKEDVTVVSSWNALGLSATSCNSFEVKALEVAANRSFVINAEPKVDAPIYKFPQQQLQEAIFAASISGMAYHFVDLVEAHLTSTKGKNGQPLSTDRTISEYFEKWTEKLEDARTKLYYAADISWQGCINFQKIKPAILYKVSAAAYELSRKAAECADALYPYCGMGSIDKSTEINRVWRDLHTAGQHSLLVFGSLPE